MGIAEPLNPRNSGVLQIGFSPGDLLQVAVSASQEKTNMSGDCHGLRSAATAPDNRYKALANNDRPSTEWPEKTLPVTARGSPD